MFYSLWIGGSIKILGWLDGHGYKTLLNPLYIYLVFRVLVQFLKSSNGSGFAYES